LLLPDVLRIPYLLVLPVFLWWGICFKCPRKRSENLTKSGPGSIVSKAYSLRYWYIFSYLPSRSHHISEHVRLFDNCFKYLKSCKRPDGLEYTSGFVRKVYFE